MEKLENYSNAEFRLTEGECLFISKMLANNECCAHTPEELLSDNFSCQTIEDFNDIMDLSPKQIAGFISSLESKQVITIEDRDGPYYKGSPKDIYARNTFEPDLYWVTDAYLESLPQDLEF